MIFFKYIPFNVLDKLILKVMLFIRNASLPGCPVFYLTRSLGGLLLDTSWASAGLCVSGLTVSPCSLTCWDMLLETLNMKYPFPHSFLPRVSRCRDPVKSFIPLSGSESSAWSQFPPVGKFLCGKGRGSSEAVLTPASPQDST